MSLVPTTTHQITTTSFVDFNDLYKSYPQFKNVNRKDTKSIVSKYDANDCLRHSHILDIKEFYYFFEYGTKTGDIRILLMHVKSPFGFTKMFITGIITQYQLSHFLYGNSDKITNYTLEDSKYISEINSEPFDLDYDEETHLIL